MELFNSLEWRDLIIIILLLVNGLLVWRSFGSIPRDIPEWLFSFLEPKIKATGTQLDDQALAIARAITEYLQQNGAGVTPDNTDITPPPVG